MSGKRLIWEDYKSYIQKRSRDDDWSVVELKKNCDLINNHMKSCVFLLGDKITKYDPEISSVFIEIFKTVEEKKLETFKSEYIHLFRWMEFVSYLTSASLSQHYHKKSKSSSAKNQSIPAIKKTDTCKKQNNDSLNTKLKIVKGELPGAVVGKVVTRFPPEPSGYLHIGHAKAALLNNYFAKKYQGKLMIRFDDTNPSKEKLEYEEVILKDLKLLDIDTSNISRTSDYFQQIQGYCEKLLREGKAYADNTPVELMRQQRNDAIESPCRSQSAEENLAIWHRMLQGESEAMSYCIRAKVDMQSKNKCMRDFVMYRCFTGIEHYRTGSRYKAYPTYDFACPIVDSLENVTHAMRTSEYADRIPQYQWVLNACEFPPNIIYEFSRLSFVNTVLSKRKLLWFIENGIVKSWDDPRFPTVRGLLRRGLQVEALLQFILDQGPSKNIVLMEWDKLWTINKQILDPKVPRFMAISAQKYVKVTLSNGPEKSHKDEYDLHPKASIGKGLRVFSKCIGLDPEDANDIQINEEITLMRWQNAICEEKLEGANGLTLVMRLNPSGDFRATKKKVHWIAVPTETELQPTKAIIREYDHLLKKKKIEENDILEDICNRTSQFDTEIIIDLHLKDFIKKGDIFQMERRGYFIYDEIDEDKKLPVYVKIPDGKSKAVSIIQTQVQAKTLNLGT